ncbi:ESX secretion-associated protein EspG [Mycolicibacterium senegalense]|uniref:ESX secretion-associated protein EspG n=1 Tax=Mycobacteriaceae TaxID=1762 RepID=UPI003AAD69E5
MLATADLSVDGALFLKRFLGIEAFPGALALLNNVAYRHDQAVVDDQTVPILVQSGLLNIDGTVEPSLLKWLRVLERPDVHIAVRSLDGGRMRRAVLARRDKEHVLAGRRNEAVNIQGIWSQGQSFDNTVSAPVWSSLRVNKEVLAPPAADMDTVTLTLDEVEQLKQLPPGKNLPWLRDHGIDPDSARVLNEVSTYSGQRAEITALQDKGITTFETPVGVVVADTSFGRVVSGVRRHGKRTHITFGPGTYARFRVAMADLIDLTPSKDWFTARPWEK